MRNKKRNKILIIAIVLIIVAGILLLLKSNLGNLNDSSITLYKQNTKVVFPSPPSGFQWIECSGMKVKFLKPDDWFISENETKVDRGITKQCVISKNDYAKAGKMTTGVQIFATQNASRVFGKNASEFAKEYIAYDKPDITKKEEIKDISQGKVTGYRRIVHMTVPGYKPYIIDVSSLGNDTTDTVYSIGFSAVESEWEKYSSIRENMLYLYSIDDEY